MLKKHLFSSLILVTSLYAPSAMAFNFEEAVVIEGSFRGIAQHCAEPEFSDDFIAGSKTQVAFALQGDDAIVPVQMIEDAIEAISRRPEIRELTQAQCDSLMPRLMLLHETRTETLKSTQELTNTLKDPATGFRP